MPLCISRNVYRTASRPHDPAEYKYEMLAVQFFIRDNPLLSHVFFHEIKNITYHDQKYNLSSFVYEDRINEIVLGVYK